MKKFDAHNYLIPIVSIAVIVAVITMMFGTSNSSSDLIGWSFDREVRLVDESTSLTNPFTATCTGAPNPNCEITCLDGTKHKCEGNSYCRGTDGKRNDAGTPLFDGWCYCDGLIKDAYECAGGTSSLS